MNEPSIKEIWVEMKNEKNPLCFYEYFKVY